MILISITTILLIMSLKTSRWRYPSSSKELASWLVRMTLRSQEHCCLPGGDVIVGRLTDILMARGDHMIMIQRPPLPRRKRRRWRTGRTAAPWFSVAATSARGGRERSHGPIWGVCVDYCCCCRRGHNAGKAADYARCRPRRWKYSIFLTTMTTRVVIPFPPYRSRRRLQHTSRPI